MNTLAQTLLVVLYIHSVYSSHYHGPIAKPVVLHNGYLADTHEVAAAKNAHLTALGQQHSYGADYGYEGSHDEEHRGSHGDIRYHGPTAKPVVLHNGYLADTLEVAAAKNAHLTALGQQHSYGADYRYEGSHDEEHRGSHGDIRYHGPTAKPVVLHNGYLADTLEVAAAKNAHLAALGQHSYGAEYGYEGSHVEEHSGSHGDTRYHGPTAIPHVLHDGHIADTHEVAAAKTEHFAAVAKAKALRGYGDHHSGSHVSGHGAENEHIHHVAPYYGLLTKPVVLKSGYLADTHEVAAAREHHLEALHGANQHGHYYHHY